MHLLFKMVLVTQVLEAKSNLTDTRHKLNDISKSTQFVDINARIRSGMKMEFGIKYSCFFVF